MSSSDNENQVKSKDEEEKKQTAGEDKEKESSQKAEVVKKSAVEEKKTSPEEKKNTEEKKDSESPAESSPAEDPSKKDEKIKEKSKVEEAKAKSNVDGNKSHKKTKSGRSKRSKKSKSKQKNKSEEPMSGNKSHLDGEDGKEVSPQDSDSSMTLSQMSTVSRKSKKIAGEEKLRIGFMGAGRMTECMIRGLLKVGKVKPNSGSLFVAAKSGRNLDTFKSMGCKTTQRSYDLFGKYRCDVIFLCVHGFVVRNCYKMGGTRPFPLTTNYVPSRKSKYFVLSMIGGIPIPDIKTVLLNPEGSHHSIAVFHRIAMNASCAYGIGLGAIDVEYDSKKCSPVVRDLLASVGQIVTIDEANMDAACAVGGNGLAIIYYFIAALSDGGFKMGLSKNMAIKMSARVMQVAAMAVLESSHNLAELRDACCSPSGAAIYGLAVMEKHDLASGIQSAVDAAYRRIKELCEIDITQH